MYSVVLSSLKNGSMAWCREPAIRNMTFCKSLHKPNKNPNQNNQNDDKMSVSRKTAGCHYKSHADQNLSNQTFCKSPNKNFKVKFVPSPVDEAHSVVPSVNCHWLATPSQGKPQSCADDMHKQWIEPSSDRNVQAPSSPNEPSLKDDLKIHYDKRVNQIKPNAKSFSFKTVQKLKKHISEIDTVRRLDETHLEATKTKYSAPLCLNNYYKDLVNNGKLAKNCVRQTGFNERHLSWYTRNDKHNNGPSCSTYKAVASKPVAKRLNFSFLKFEVDD